MGFGIGPIAVRWIPGVNSESMSGILYFIKMSYVVVLIGAALSAVNTSAFVHFVGNFIRCAGNGMNYVYARFCFYFIYCSHFYRSYSAAFLQVSVPEHFRGRVFAFEAAINTLTLAASQLLSGYAIDELNLTPMDLLRFLTLNCILMLVLWFTHFAMSAHLYERLLTVELTSKPADSSSSNLQSPVGIIYDDGYSNDRDHHHHLQLDTKAYHLASVEGSSHKTSSKLV